MEENLIDSDHELFSEQFDTDIASLHGEGKEEKHEFINSNKYTIYNNPPFLGFSGEELKLPAWKLEGRSRQSLHIINLYRKIIMSNVGIYKLKIRILETDDPFIVEEFIEKRIKEIPISEDDVDDEFIIDITNSIGQELMITTEHIRWNDKENNVTKSAMDVRNLCDSYLVLKLGIGKHIKIVLQKEILSPLEDDKHRGVMFTAYDIPEQIKHEEQEEKIVFSHKRDISEIEIFSFGSLKTNFLDNYPCYSIIADFVENNVQNIEIIQSRDEITVVLHGLPHYLIDPLICEIGEELLEEYKQIIPTKTSMAEPCINLIKHHYEDINKKESDVLLQIITDGLEVLEQKIKDFEYELIQIRDQNHLGL